MQLYAILVFALSYLVIATQRLPFTTIDRPTGALLGASLMVAGGVLRVDQALKEAIDWRTIALLFGMLSLSSYLSAAGAFSLLSSRLRFLTRRPRALLVWLIFGSGALSALLLNDTVCLMLTPLILQLTQAARLPPRPYLFALALSANVGGVVTFTGNPQNMIVGVRSQIPYARYFLEMLPVGLVCLVVTAMLLLWIFREELSVEQREVSQEAPIIDRPLLWKGALVLLLVVLAFLVGFDLAGSAVAGAVALIVVANRPPKPLLERIDWPLLLFFAALFVLVRGVEESGATAAAAKAISGLSGSPLLAVPLFALASLIGSNLFSNVPFVLVVSPWLTQAPEAGLYWRALALTATFAGNLTLLGSVANLIVFEGARGVVKVSFWEYLKVGLPVTLVTTIIGVLGILLVHSLTA